MAIGGRAYAVVLLHTIGIGVFSASLPQGPSLPQQIRLARASLKAGRVELALRQASAARAVYPSDPALQSVLGDIAYRKADFNAAEEHYRKAVAADNTCARG